MVYPQYVGCMVSRAAADVERNWNSPRREHYSLSESNNSKQIYCTFIPVIYLAFIPSESSQLPHSFLFLNSLFQSTIISFNTISLFRSNFLLVLLASRETFALLFALIDRVVFLRLIIRLKKLFLLIFKVLFWMQQSSVATFSYLTFPMADIYHEMKHSIFHDIQTKKDKNNNGP